MTFCDVIDHCWKKIIRTNLSFVEFIEGLLKFLVIKTPIWVRSFFFNKLNLS